MKTKRFLLLSLALGACPLLASAADVLATDTVVFLQPDAKSPVVTRLKAGSTVIYTGDAPAGWRRAEVSGTFEAFVHNDDITKGLEVREGSHLYTAPKKDAAILTTVLPGDKSEVIGLASGTDFCQVKVEKKLQGFVAVGAMANTPSDNRLAAAPPVTTPVVNPNAPGKPVTTGNTADMPRLLTGTFGLARRPIINPNPVYDYQLTDANGRRLAYVDTKRLVLTDKKKIEDFLERVVVINGAVRNTVEGKDLVVAAESIQIK